MSDHRYATAVGYQGKRRTRVARRPSPKVVNRIPCVLFQPTTKMICRRPQVLTNPGSSHRFAETTLETTLGFDKADDALQAFALPQIGHDKRPFATHSPRVGVHFLQRCADIRREVDLVDDEKVRSGDAWVTL